MRRLADGGVVHVQIAPDRPDHDVARVDPDPDLDRDAVRPLYLVTVPAHPLLHAQGRVAGADRVVLVRDGRAEERHDPIAHDLIDGALVAVNRLHHVLQHRVEELACLLRVAVGEQLHRALQVGEQHGHLLALAFQGGLRGEDLLGEVLWGVRLGRGEAHLTGVLTANWSPALVAESRRGR